MSVPKFIPAWLYRTAGISYLLLCAILAGYFFIESSGPYEVFAELTADSSGTYSVTLAFLLTFLVLLLPGFVVLMILRPFSKMPSLKAQMLDPGPFKAPANINIDASKFGQLPTVLSRIAAFIIDRTIVIFIIALPAAFFMVIGDKLHRSGILYYALMFIFILFVIAGVVYSYSRDMFGGKSIARRMLKQKVIDINTGKPIGGWRSFKREIIIHFAPLILIELVLLYSNSLRRRMGDNWAKTIVVKDNPEQNIS